MQPGIARFNTVYPGWYQGRTVHIHVLVHVGGNAVHTGQLFFDDALTDTVFARKPYSARGQRDQRNSDDSIYANGGSRSLLRMQAPGHRLPRHHHDGRSPQLRAATVGAMRDDA